MGQHIDADSLLHTTPSKLYVLKPLFQTELPKSSAQNEHNDADSMLHKSSTQTPCSENISFDKTAKISGIR